MAVSFATYEQVALEDDTVWELVCGRLREKPGMSQDHNERASSLTGQLFAQLDRRLFSIRMNASALRVRESTYFVPDVVVIPKGTPNVRPRETGLETYEVALPFVVEVWSRSTGKRDLETKVPEYQFRGDLEIWRIHPRRREVTVWRLKPGGRYTEMRHSGGAVPIESLPGVTIDLDELFD